MAVKMDPPIHQPPSARESHLQVEVEVVLVNRARRQSRYRSTESAGRRRRRQGVRGPPKREGNPWGRALMVQGRAATQPHGRRALCTPGTRAASAARARPAAGSPSKPASRRPSIARTPPSAVWPGLQELAVGIAVDAHNVAAAMEVSTAWFSSTIPAATSASWGGRYSIYRPGWTVNEIPSTPWPAYPGRWIGHVRPR